MWCAVKLLIGAIEWKTLKGEDFDWILRTNINVYVLVGGLTFAELNVWLDKLMILLDFGIVNN